MIDYSPFSLKSSLIYSILLQTFPHKKKRQYQTDNNFHYEKLVINFRIFLKQIVFTSRNSNIYVNSMKKKIIKSLIQHLCKFMQKSCQLKVLKQKKTKN